jgi:predicted lipoprotein with Yx(FWY)xxD motif
VQRTVVLFIGIILASSGAAALARTQSRHTPAHQAAFYTLNVRSTKLGKILANTSGSILYEFTGDHKKKDTCIRIKGCAKRWTPMPTTGHDSAGPGVHASLISSISLPKPYGYRQITYAGHPLYIFTSAPTSTSYVGTHEYGGRWDALTVRGKAVK